MTDDKTRDDIAIRVDRLHKTFGGEDGTTAVDGVSFEVPSGSVVGILGPNGAGKTTTIKSILGLVQPDAGEIEVSNIDVREQPRAAYARMGAILEGARNIYWRLTVRENLEFFAGLGGDHPERLRERHDRLLERFELADWADTPVRELSRGMKQKVSLATTLARDVDVVFMDEPTLGLDVEASVELRSELRRLSADEEVTVVLTSHDMDVIEQVCDSVILLTDGSVLTHEEVDRLIDTFRTKEYRVTLAAPVSDDVRRRVERVTDADWERSGDRVSVAFRAPRGETVYDVVELLSDAGIELRDIESMEPNLEDVFLHLTEETTESSEFDGLDQVAERGRS
ncbi:ABC transporter ATP-binding protein [Halobaculum sp. MBLA0147]|uniref:ABC transporter ATP-binding protein n=1 Tax=Halobaculum sp. MBLA0147 TaxID=3079934 RepID=UPI00352517F7